MADRTIDIDLVLNTSGNAVRGAKQLERSLEDVEKQANETREKMERIAQVGARLAGVGAAIVAPFALSLKKFVDTQKEINPTAQKIASAMQRMEESQVRLGAVVAEQVAPVIEDLANLIEDVADFAEKNPDAVKAALGIGGSLIALGAIVTTTAQIVTTIATVQGLLAGAGITGGIAGGGAIAGGAAAGAGLTAAIAAAAPILAAAIGGQIGIIISNAITGRDDDLGDLLEVIKGTLVIAAEGIDGILAFFGADVNFSKAIANALGFADIPTGRQVTENGRALAAAIGNYIKIGFTNFGKSIYDGLIRLAQSITDFFARIAAKLGFKASGGYADNGIYRMGEQGREFVLNAAATRSAENLLGGRLSQDRVLSSMTTNINLSNGMTVAQARRMMSANRADIIGTLAGV
jgi:uncharacterized protein YukE